MFLINKITNSFLTYESLIHQVNKKQQLAVDITPSLNNIEGFYIELLSLIINNINIVVHYQEINLKSETISFVNGVVIKNMDDLINRVIKSKSTISLFTSGTTGQPKKITHCMDKFVEMCRIKSVLDIPVWAMLYNPTHMAGLQVFFQAFLNKNKIVYLFQTDRSLFLESCKDEKITHVSATPTFYRLLGPFNFVLNDIIRCTLGGEKSDKKLINNLKKIFVNARINNIYASTEAGSVFISKDDFFEVIPSLKDKVKFIDNEIVLHNSLLGEVTKEEWFFTGDIVEFINDKQFLVISRKSDFVNIGGNRVNLNKVEYTIRGLDEVVDVSITSQKNSILGKILIANVVLEKELTKKELKQLIKPLLINYMIPAKINIVDKLEMTKSGKLKRL